MLGGQCEAGYSCAYMNTVSWQSPTTPLPVENNPSVVFERLFGEGGTPGRAARSDAAEAEPARSRQSGSRPPAAVARAVRPARGLPSISMRSAKSSGAFRRPNEQNAELDAAGARTADWAFRRAYDDHLKLLYDLQWLAFQGDLTRVFTLMYGRELNSRSYPEIGISEPHHGLSHHGDKPEQIEKFAKLNSIQVELFAYFLEKLRVDAGRRRQSARPQPSCSTAAP